MPEIWENKFLEATCSFGACFSPDIVLFSAWKISLLQLKSQPVLYKKSGSIKCFFMGETKNVKQAQLETHFSRNVEI